MLRLVLLLAFGTVALAQSSAQKHPKPENRDSYSSYDTGYTQYQTQPYPYYGQGGGKFASLDKFFSGVSLPSAHNIITGIIYVVAVAGVAAAALVGLFLVLKLIGLKLPMLTNLKNTVLNKVDKVNGRMLEDGWNMLVNAIDKYSKV